LQKSSITLIETLISLILLSILIGGFSNLLLNSNSSYNQELLNQTIDLENIFTLKNYQNLKKSNVELLITYNDKHIKPLAVTKYSYENKNIKVFKYEK